MFSQEAGRPFYQTGLRFWVIPARMQIDVTYGNRLGRSDGNRWFTLGVRLLTPPFLP